MCERNQNLSEVIVEITYQMPCFGKTALGTTTLKSATTFRWITPASLVRSPVSSSATQRWDTKKGWNVMRNYVLKLWHAKTRRVGEQTTLKRSREFSQRNTQTVNVRWTSQIAIAAVTRAYIPGRLKSELFYVLLPCMIYALVFIKSFLGPSYCEKFTTTVENPLSEIPKSESYGILER